MATFPTIELEARELSRVSGKVTRQGLDLLGAINELEHEHETAMHMLGTIIATLNLPDNRARFAAGDPGALKNFLAIADEWTAKYRQFQCRAVQLRTVKPADWPTP